MGLFSRNLPETAEEQYFRENAGRLAHIAHQKAKKAEDEAYRWQMTVDVSSRVGRRDSNPGEAQRAARARNRAVSRRDAALAEAKRLEEAAKPAEKKRSSWW